MPFDAAPAASAAALWAGLLMLLLLILSILVVRQRRTHKAAYGDGDQASLAGAIRAFGNASEYIPAALGGLAILAVADTTAWVVHLAGGVMFLGRVIHAVGLSRTTGVSKGRVYGMLLTWTAYLFIAVALLFRALG